LQLLQCLASIIAEWTWLEAMDVVDPVSLLLLLLLLLLLPPTPGMLPCPPPGSGPGWAGQ
jgi:hypothetical protein